MIAIVIFMIIMIGGHAYFSRSQMIIAYDRTKRLAVAAAAERMEYIRQLGYAAISSSLDETAVTISLGSRSGTRTTTITNIDDAGDGLGGSDADGNSVDYKQITVEIAWQSSSAQTYSLSTYRAE